MLKHITKQKEKLHNDFTSHDGDVESVMRKYDRESNTRIWEGTPAIIIKYI